MNLNNSKIAVIGLGYVGLPLAVAFGEKYSVIGFDINLARVNELAAGMDSTFEIKSNKLKSVLTGNSKAKNGLFPTSNDLEIADCNIFIITVPTPVDKHNKPLLMPLVKATETVAKFLKKGDIIIYESTVYPGVTEEEMVPILETKSGLVFNEDFYCGYSPERINPGDEFHTVTQILKVTSGSTPEIAEFIDALYRSIILAGTHMAPSIKVAEAAKVIENAQRDINIAFINELAKIFSLLKIDTQDVLEAAGTKWNFLKFKPGLVGGHCIGVDPYYLAQKAQEVGYHPDIILAGRRVNDGMGDFIAKEVVKLMIQKEISLKESKVLIMGFTFKEDCPDIRNTKVVDIYYGLKDFGLNVDIFDPIANAREVNHEYGIKIMNNKVCLNKKFDSVILAVAHKEFITLDYKSLLESKGVLYDVKSVLDKNIVDARL